MIDSTVETFTRVIGHIETLLRPELTKLFWSLVTLSVAWSFIQWALNATDFRSVVAGLARKILIVGFLSASFNYSGVWSKAIIDSFKELAGLATGDKGISPSYVFESALTVVGKALANISYLDIGASLVTALVAIAILICFAALVAVMVLTLIEAQFVALFNLILFAIGGSDFTIDYVKASWRYTMSVGLKVFTVYALVGIGDGIMNEAIASAKADQLQPLLGALCSSLIFLIIVKQIPDSIQSVVAGVTLTGSTNAAQSVTNLAAATTGMSMMLKEAVKHGAIKSAGNPKAFLAHTAAAMAKSAGSDVADRMKGSPGSHMGTMGGRMASRISGMGNPLGGATIQPQGSAVSASNKNNPSPQQSSAPYLSPLNNYSSEAQSSHGPSQQYGPFQKNSTEKN